MLCLSWFLTNPAKSLVRPFKINPTLRSCGSMVTDMTKVDKNEAKRTKLGTGMKRVQGIKAEVHVGNPNSFDGLIALANDPRDEIDTWREIKDEGL
nr:hypothetical protein [Tanacetum cinerariifolium]